ncbi:MAG TPA: hypothetical protein VM030_09020 [Acidimicrobiales bacterium]|nr:hypothetical protein [Acidimicrobiales bacterium]
MSDARVAAWRAFLAAQRRVLQRLEHELQDAHGIGLTWYEVLHKLHEAHDRRLHMAELADSVLLPVEGVARVVARLEDANLVRTHRCLLHGQEWEVALTSTGRTRISRAMETHGRGIDEHFGVHLSDEEAVALTRALGRMAEPAGA